MSPPIPDSRETLTKTAAQRPPYHFVAWGRLFGGLAISVFGAFGLHAIQNKDANALSIVASVSGLVLNGWGFVATNLSPRAKREDVIWSWLLFGLLLASLGANAYYNRRDYGIVFIGIELFAIATAAGLGLAAFAIAGFFFKRRIATDHERRGRCLIAMTASALIFWPLVRWPALALALSGAIGPSEQGDLERITAAAMRRDMNPTLLRWAVRLALKSENAERRGRAIDASRTGNLLDASELAVVVLNDPSDYVRIDALRLLALKDPKSAASTLMESVKAKTALSAFFHSDIPALLSPEQLETVFQSRYAQNAVSSAYHGDLANAMMAAVRKFGMDKVVEMCDPNPSTAMFKVDYDAIAWLILRRSGSQAQAEIFDYWKPCVERVYNLKGWDLDELWKNHHFGAVRLWSAALKSNDEKVAEAAYRSMLSSVLYPNHLRALVEPDTGSDEEKLRAACKTLDESIERFLELRSQGKK